MANHPNRNRLAQYGGRILSIDGERVVELRDANDNAKRRFQYRRSPDGGLERRMLREDGSAFVDTGSPWERCSEHELASLRSMRGQYHPILDSL